MMHRWVGPSEQRLDPDGSVIFRRPRYVVTHYSRFRKPALSEVQQVDPRAEAIGADSARTIVSVTTPGCGLVEAFQAQHPTFVQHLAPVRARVRLDGDAGDLARISSAVHETQPLDRGRTFAVQCRKAECTIAGPHGRAPYGARDVEGRVVVPTWRERDSPSIAIVLTKSFPCFSRGHMPSWACPRWRRTSR